LTQRIASLFEQMPRHGEKMAEHPRLQFVPSRLTLGAVQIGLPYGIANKAGLPTNLQAQAILDEALAAGITTLDTARAYGESEARIGRWRAARERHDIKIVTKFPKIADVSEAEAVELVQGSIERSRRALGMDNLDLVLAHNAADLLHPGVARALVDAQRHGHVRAIGASCYEPAEALLILERLPVAALQIPMSLCDQRFAAAGVIGAAAVQGVALFIRSVFLQGAHLLSTSDLPGHLRLLAGPLARLDALAGELGRSRSELILCAVRDRAAHASLLVGVERPEQLAVHVAAAGAPALPDAASKEAFGYFADLPPDVSDPRQWPRK
jgi:aryl-alcohol dehydrogenase-like predicted oxidoreductase